ncbi:gluzincin family metallopeptidase [Mangrovimonas aestuarii]|uniref:metalloprotease n=1 Tax=Mangrovimonas aestuarii TaxID=3018443 RepID=UPI00237935C7|nr:metalloprotease [Mangrovimonas aestuarii]
MKTKLLNLLMFLGCSVILHGQNAIDIYATFNTAVGQVEISQKITYQNTSNDSLRYIYLNDWPNSYSSKKTPLAKRFAEEYKTEFHFAKPDDRGYTEISSITNLGQEVSYERLEGHPDIIKLKLNQIMAPGQSYTLNLHYMVKIPKDKFTRFGKTSNGDFNLKYWYITPAVYDGQWHYYSNKDLDDLYNPKADIKLTVEYPNDYYLSTDLDEINHYKNQHNQISELEGKERVNTKLFLNRTPRFETVKTDYLTIVSDLEGKDLSNIEDLIILDKIAAFITNNLGPYPHDKFLLSEVEYKNDPVYGLNLLPNFIRPFRDNFQYELKVLKTALHNYLENTILINPRKDQWVNDGLQIYFMMKYMEAYYPDMKIVGTLANIWGVRAFHASDLNFNDKYSLLYMHMARNGIDQPLTMAKDSLLKFNKNIANKYKAGVGLAYLDDFINQDHIEESIKAFVHRYSLQPVSAHNFETILKASTTKNIDWFFDEYLATSKKIDFKIKKVQEDSTGIHVTIKNKRDNNMPVSLFALYNDEVVSKTWIENVNNERTIILTDTLVDKLVLNYNNSIPEYNQRDNWKSLKGVFFNNKPLQFRLFKDVEDPNYNQVFFMPLFQYNYYDGFSPGLNLYNKTAINKPFGYSFRPTYGFKSKQLVGSGVLSYVHYDQTRNLYRTSFGVSGQYSNYAPNLNYTSFSPFLFLRFKDYTNLRDNERRYLNFRFISIYREDDPTGIYNVENKPNYNVFNIRYGKSDPNLINFSSYNYDLELSSDFGKLSYTFEYRKLTQRNRQYNFRLFAGMFLYNQTYKTSDFFSYALDRPTDYLFDFDYLGRSEDTGIFSQQLIIAEGGFKSKLTPAYANQWIATANFSTTIWKYIQAYGDAGFVKNHFADAKFVYDSGVRVNLVADYFELYFPVYSNLGWEVSQAHYSQKIRFVITLSPRTLFGLFTRRWY